VPYQLAEAARDDVKDILTRTARRFGPLQRRRYNQLVETAAMMIADQPMRPGSRQREELGPGIRSFHVELASRRAAAAAHVLYYVQGTLDDGRDGVIILRVLHERMDPTRHIGQET